MGIRFVPFFPPFLSVITLCRALERPRHHHCHQGLKSESLSPSLPSSATTSNAHPTRKHNTQQNIMSTVSTFVNAAAASSAVRPTAAASSSRRASSTVVRASADKSSTSVVLGGVTPLPSARAARVHRRRGAVVMRAEEGLQRDNPELEERFATIGCVAWLFFLQGFLSSPPLPIAYRRERSPPSLVFSPTTTTTTHQLFQ